MVKKCCVYDCKTNYDSERKKYVSVDGKQQSVFRFPHPNTEAENRQRWIDVVSKVNANLKVGSETVICSLHWPPNYPQYKKKGHWRPSVPPSIFPESIPASIVPDPPPQPRETLRTSNHDRNTFPDELEEFDRQDIVSFQSLTDDLLQNKRTFHTPVVSYISDGNLHVQSTTLHNGVAAFLVIIEDSLKFSAFYHGVRFYVASLTANRITTVQRWSTLEEVLRFLTSSSVGEDKKIPVLDQQIDAMSASKVGEKIYS